MLRAVIPSGECGAGGSVEDDSGGGAAMGIELGCEAGPIEGREGLHGRIMRATKGGGLPDIAVGARLKRVRNRIENKYLLQTRQVFGCIFSK
jgi:hypothetical protein